MRVSLLVLIFGGGVLCAGVCLVDLLELLKGGMGIAYRRGDRAMPEEFA